MKKWKQLAFIFMLTLSLVTFSACGKGKDDADTQNSVNQEETDRIGQEKEEGSASDAAGDHADDQTDRKEDEGDATADEDRDHTNLDNAGENMKDAVEDTGDAMRDTGKAIRNGITGEDDGTAENRTDTEQNTVQ